MPAPIPALTNSPASGSSRSLLISLERQLLSVPPPSRPPVHPLLEVETPSDKAMSPRGEGRRSDTSLGIGAVPQSIRAEQL